MTGFKKVLTSLLIMAVGFINCSESQTIEEDSYEISIEEVRKYIETDKDVILIDVRTAPEYNGSSGHIPGTILRSLQEIENWITEFDSLKQKEIIFICRSGNRSGVATRYMKEHGFRKVYNMVGGMLAWNRAKYLIDQQENTGEKDEQ